jgi:hypothetical protein
MAVAADDNRKAIAAIYERGTKGKEGSTRASTHDETRADVDVEIGGKVEPPQLFHWIRENGWNGDDLDKMPKDAQIWTVAVPDLRLKVDERTSDSVFPNALTTGARGILEGRMAKGKSDCRFVRCGASTFA